LVRPPDEDYNLSAEFMMTLLSILFYLAAGIAVAGLAAFLARRFFQVDPAPDALYFFFTEDGWRLCLRHYKSAEPIPGAAPVLLCPGVGMDAVVFDLMEEASLARFLREHGHDVWLLDMRGRGHADRPRLWGRRRRSWSYDDFVDFDLPAALEEICRLTGAAQVQWVGIDTGALALLCSRSEQVSRRVASLVGIGVTTSFKRQRALLGPYKSRLMAALWTPTAVRLGAYLVGRLTPPPWRALANADNVDGHVLRRVLVNGLVRLSPRELDQYAHWLDLDLMDSHDQGIDYRKNLARITVPTLLVAGLRDPLSPVAAVESTLEAMPGVAEGRVLLAGRISGMSSNYGHLDMLVGRNADRDLFPHLLAWLDSHCGAEVEGDRPRPLTVAGRDQDLAVPVEERADPTTKVQLREEVIMGPEPPALVAEDSDPLDELFEEDPRSKN